MSTLLSFNTVMGGPREAIKGFDCASREQESSTDSAGFAVTLIPANTIDNRLPLRL